MVFWSFVKNGKRINVALIGQCQAGGMAFGALLCGAVCVHSGRVY